MAFPSAAGIPSLASAIRTRSARRVQAGCHGHEVVGRRRPAKHDGFPQLATAGLVSPLERLGIAGIQIGHSPLAAIVQTPDEDLVPGGLIIAEQLFVLWVALRDLVQRPRLARLPLVCLLDGPHPLIQVVQAGFRFLFGQSVDLPSDQGETGLRRQAAGRADRLTNADAMLVRRLGAQSAPILVPLGRRGQGLGDAGQLGMNHGLQGIVVVRIHDAIFYLPAMAVKWFLGNP